ncbi:hypothetical protein CCR75_002806 [Bremia lactucae]|uniref:Glycosyltransferase 61 catalytic domain-containing protein n=1 Tax=Bremia lactucae TaxID=4779 RepID=A0A976FQN1_BRELC|nr:hypothetical protein CCR75_002806 [Bremia lactucae]
MNLTLKESCRLYPAAAPTNKVLDLDFLIQKRRKMAVASKSVLLHLDDLVHSNSYLEWAPIIVSNCLHGMDKRAAPCVKEAHKTNLVEAQELMYPPFRLKLPSFSNLLMKAEWVSRCQHYDDTHITKNEEWAEYPSFTGQNMVFLNAPYQGEPRPDVWSPYACMGQNVSYASFLRNMTSNVTNTANKTSVETLVVATSPDSWSFQHFLDRVAVVWSQAQLVIPTIEKNDTIIVTGSEPRDKIVNDIYTLMVGQHLHDSKLVFAKRLVFSCRAPLIHPFTTQRITETIFQALPPTSGASDRNVILFLSRSIGGVMRNGGRQILNEFEVYDAISTELNATDRPERLQYFHLDKFDGLDDIASFIRDNVKMMIGPHGAAFYNSRFALPRTALIEIIPDPKLFFRQCFWEQARLLGQDYSAYIGNTKNKNFDLIIDDIPSLVQQVLDRLMYLDTSYRIQDALQHGYQWELE